MDLGRKIALNAAVLGAARIVNALLGIVAVGITTRYLGVDGYGAIVVALAFVAVINTLNDVGVGTVVAREIARRPAETDRLLNAGFTIILLFSLVGAAIGIGVMFLLYPGGGHTLERQGIALLLLAPLPLAAAGSAAGTWFVSQQRAFMGGLGAFGGSVLTLIVLGLVVAFDWGFIGIAIAYAGQAVGFGAVMVFALREVRLRPLLDTALCRELIAWALPLGAAFLVGSLYYRIDVVLLSKLGTEHDVGLYGLAYRFVDTLLVLPGYVMITLLPEFSRLREQRQRVADIVQKASEVMIVGVVPLLVVFIVFARDVADILGGPSFLDAGPLLQLLMIGVGASFLGSVFVEPIVALGHQKWMLWMTLVLLTANVIANVLLIPPYGATGAAVAFLGTEILALVITASLYSRLAALPRPTRLPRIAAAAAAMGLVTLLKVTPVGDLLGDVGSVLVLGSLGSLVYLVGLYAFGGMPPSLHDTLGAPVLARLRALTPARGRA